MPGAKMRTLLPGTAEDTAEQALVWHLNRGGAGRYIP